MSETKTEYVVEYTRRGDKFVSWRVSESFSDKSAAEKKFDADKIRFPKLQHRLIRVTVLKESK